MAAVLGAYVFTNVISLLLYFVFVNTDLLYLETDSVNRDLLASGGNAALGAVLLSLLIYPLAGMWVFYARSATRAWTVMLVPSLLGAGLIYLLLPAHVRESLGG